MAQINEQNKQSMSDRLKMLVSRLRRKNNTTTETDKTRSKLSTIANRLGRVFAEAFSVVLTLAAIWFASVNILMNRDNVDLAFFKPHYEQWFSQAFDGRKADIETYQARWVQERQSIEILAENIDVIGKDGTTQHVGLVRGEFAVSQNILDKPQLSALTIDGGAMTIVRREDGSVQLGLGTPDTFENVGALWSSNQLNEDASQEDSSDAPKQDPAAIFQQLSKISIVKGTVFIRDSVSGFNLDLVEIDGEFSFDGEFIDINSLGQIQSNETKAPFTAQVRTTPDRADFASQIDIKKLNPIDIAPKEGRYAILGNLNAPVSLAVDLTYTAESGFKDFNVDFAADAGQLKTGTTFKPFQQTRVKADYQSEKQNIEVSQLSIRSLALNLDAKGSVNDIGTPQDGFLKKPFQYDIDLDAVRINPGVKFDGPINIRSGDVVGKIDLENKIYTFDKFDLDFGDFQSKLTAELIAADDVLFEKITSTGIITGEMSPEQLLGFWPNQFGLGARNWIKSAIKSAKLKDFNFTMAIDGDDLRNGKIANDHLNLTFDVENAQVQYMSRMPWLRDTFGTGVLQGNRVDFKLTSGRVDDLTIKKGFVEIPVLFPKGGDLIIDLEGSGEAKEMLRVTNFPPFEFSKRFNMEPAKFGGDGDIALKITRPLLVFFDQNRIIYELSGKFKDVTLPVGVGRFGLTDGELDLKADSKGISIKGPINIGKWQTVLDWEKKLGVVSSPAKYNLTGTIGRDDLDNFGIGLRRHFGGAIDVKLTGLGDGIDVQQIRLFADFFNTELNVGSLWNKQIGEPGSLSGMVALDSEKGARIDDLQVRSRGLDIAGSIAIGNDMKLENLDIKDARIDGFVDAAVQAKPTADGVLSMFLTGKYLNVEQWVDKAFRTQTSAVTAPIRLTASIDTLALNENYQVTNASALFSHDGTATQQARLKGQAKDGPLVAEVASDFENGFRKIRVEVPNAGRALLTLLGLDSIRNGNLIIEGKLPPAGKEGGITGDIALSDFTLVRAPAFAQMLSLASLTGLADTLGGSGLAFETLESKFGLENGVLKVRDARASGPALGLTVEGDIGITAKTMDLDGVLVPSYTANSLLGDIPLLGDIIVGKKGEGVFALNYSMKGPFSATQVSVNPLSALTPGFLRRIFDVKRDDIEDETVKKLIETQKQEN